MSFFRPINPNVLSIVSAFHFSQNFSYLEVNRKGSIQERDATHRLRRSLNELDVRERNHWRTISMINGIHPHYEISYRQLEPSSVYKFRLFAFNSVGVGHASPESDYLRVPGDENERLVVFLFIMRCLSLFCER